VSHHRLMVATANAAVSAAAPTETNPWLGRPRRRRRTGSPFPPWGRGSRGHRRGPTPLGLPLAPLVGQVPYDLLLLGVDADHRLAGRKVRRGSLVHAAELGVSVGVLGPLVLLGRDLEAVAETGEQLADLGRAHPVAQARELRVQGPHALGRPAQRGGRVAPGGGLDQVVQGSQQAGSMSCCFRPAPGRRTRLLTGTPASTSAAPFWTVERLIPVTRATGRSHHDPEPEPQHRPGSDVDAHPGGAGQQPACLSPPPRWSLRSQTTPTTPLIDQVIHAQALSRTLSGLRLMGRV
jgi:hypothetical protein